jgi:hypothetical protein
LTEFDVIENEETGVKLTEKLKKIPKTRHFIKNGY